MLLLSGGMVLVADQVLKGWVLAGAGTRGGEVVAPGSFVRVRPVRGRGIVAAHLGVRPALLVIAWLSSLLVVLVAVPLTGQFRSTMARVGLGMAMGGAAGNLFDVVIRRGVVDYVAVGRWPAFNLADVAIVAGVIGALVAG